ncbi:AraC family transcriptional regulator [Dyadobacter sp. CY312]|uniref:AraC family transcriptional regulator n=1 Tax=Dyadobacter sp. CY312 TaxID=2907303 RepID=UPI001F1832C1|nr:AraC family transcriptional regulator [Dyadobacter sp. CY312]MCE7040476.1 AraC family transcriptional regulator [Dyadobacter sp. CY312]
MNNNDFKSTFSLLNADYVRLNKTWNYRNVISPFYRIYLIDDGLGSLGDKDNDLILEKGFLYLVPSFTLCNHHCPHHLSQFYIHVLEESADGNSLFAANRKIHKIASTEEDIAKFRRIIQLNPGRGLKGIDNPREYERQSTLAGFQQRNDLISLADYIETHGLIFQLIARFLRAENFKLAENKKIPSKVLDAINYIQTHLHTNITVEHLAERASQNPNYFSRVFTRYTAERPLAYIQKKRVERAQYLILTTELPLSEIAADTGFESLSYFSRIFKNIAGQTPSRYKTNNSIV